MIDFMAFAAIPATIVSASSGSNFDWTDFGPFGAAIVIAWFLLNRSDKVVEKEKLEAERDLQRALDSLEQERKSHEATRQLLYDKLYEEKQKNEGSENE